MADNLTDVAENLALDWLTGTGSPIRPSGLTVRLMTVPGSDSSTGTEVTGGSYDEQSVTFTTAASGAATNTADLTFSGMPATTVVGLEVWDSAGTPRRIWWGPLAASKNTNDGDDFVIAAGALSLSLG